MKILITGVHGFVGQNLVKALSKQHTLYGLDILTPFLPGVEHTYLWSALEEVPEVDAIIHLAGKAHDVKHHDLCESYFTINTGLTQQIFDYYSRKSIKCFIFFSTVKAAADTVDGVLTEEVQPHPVGPYGKSKRMAEEYLLEQWTSIASRDTSRSMYILRPCMIHGPGNKGNLNLLYQVAIKGMPWPLGKYDNLRSFTSVGNLTFILERLLLSDAPSGIYNVGDDAPISTNELIRLIAQSGGRKPLILSIPKGIIRTLAHLGTFLHLPLNDERLSKLTENYVVSNEKIKQALHIDRLPVDSRDGLFLTLKSFE